jgi:hypothetical protein
LDAHERVVQRNRRRNLRLALAELRGPDRQQDVVMRAAVLGLSRQEFRAIREGAPIGDRLAREIEWAMHRRRGWLDEWPHPEPY